MLDPEVRTFARTNDVQCPDCGNRQVGLIRAFGTSYLNDFEGVPYEESHAFWASMPKGLSARALEGYITNKLTERKIHRHTDSVNGQFMPLSWYEAQGFDVASIEANTTERDKETHPVLGMTYRVNIRTTKNANYTNLIASPTSF